MKKVISVSLSEKGIDQLIEAVEQYRRWLREKSELLVERLANEGYQIASVRFSQAEYDGKNDTSVSVEARGQGVRAVVAAGAATLFIEFGTGVTYPDNHPEAVQNGMIRGSYGKGRGKQQSWGYYGEPGTNGRVIRSTEKGELILTHGNPANMPMYETVKELESRLPGIVREVFR